MVHVPVLASPEFDGKTGNGFWADALAQTDAYVGELHDLVDQLGVKDNTIFIFTSDNGPEMLEPYHGWSGPWRGGYFTGLEGSLRVPFIVRWPGNIPAGRISNEIVHEMDIFPTMARVAGGKVPTDRAIDGVDQLDFLMGKGLDNGTDAVKDWSIPRIFNLYQDPTEEHALSYEIQSLWVRYPAGKILVDHLASLQKYPPIKPGTPDPYVPPTLAK
jgi:arylsulfatase A-like enzyme